MARSKSTDARDIAAEAAKIATSLIAEATERARILAAGAAATATALAPEVVTVGAKLSSHEAVCAERYASININLKRIDKFMWFVSTTFVFSMGVVAWFFISHKMA
ncbi:hypothetical protein UFOVP1339_2 [uncultured Caudovirales phage]|uniref:Uncharacterized protein n=1 Tax=uncultured Caudovirales phage TaxID=2100421 RepID=A0A6J5S2G9_9CAUD|nr:hypothetical protein UFOVP1339_2 [uncultured Caudovirales phage]